MNFSRRTNYYIKNIFNPELILPSEDLPNIESNEMHVWHLFVILSYNRNALQNYLTKHGIQTVIHYPVPPHKQKAYKELNKINLPITERIHEQPLSLPIYPGLAMIDLEYIIEKINKY